MFANFGVVQNCCKCVACLLLFCLQLLRLPLNLSSTETAENERPKLNVTSAKKLLDFVAKVQLPCVDLKT
jgi:hypothetical protein